MSRYEYSRDVYDSALVSTVVLSAGVTNLTTSKSALDITVVSATDTTITFSGLVGNLPATGYVEVISTGEVIKYAYVTFTTSTSGVLNYCRRGTGATAYSAEASECSILMADREYATIRNMTGSPIYIGTTENISAGVNSLPVADGDAFSTKGISSINYFVYSAAGGNVILEQYK